MNFSPLNWCDPEHEMVGILQANVKATKGFEPHAIVGLGGTDTRLWRYRDIPAYVYGPSPRYMGKSDVRALVAEVIPANAPGLKLLLREATTTTWRGPTSNRCVGQISVCPWTS